MNIYRDFNEVKSTLEQKGFTDIHEVTVGSEHQIIAKRVDDKVCIRGRISDVTHSDFESSTDFYSNFVNDFTGA